MTRRRFLAKAAAAAAGLGILGLGAQCGPTPTPEVIREVVKETVVVEKEVVKEVPKEVVKEVVKEVEKEVTKIVEVAPTGPPLVKLLIMAWITGEVPVDNLVRQYNSEHPEVKVEVDRWVSGWDKKHLSAVRAGNPIWNTSSEWNPWREGLAGLKMGLVQPMDDFIAASKTPGADKLVEDWLDLVRDQMIIEGSIYALPMNMDVTAFGLQKEYCEAVGITDVPETWEDITVAAKAASEHWKGEEVFGMITGNWWVYNGPGGVFYNVTKKPFSDEGILNVTAEEFIWSLELCKGWQDEGITPMPFWQDQSDIWKRNKVAMCFNPGAWIIWGQKIWGKEAISDPLPMPNYPGGGGAACEVMAMGLLAGAPYPQEAMDCLIWLWGPENMAMQEAICNTAKTPAYKSLYENVVKPNPDWAWMLDIKAMYDRCIPLPHVASYAIQNDMLTTWTQKYFLGEEKDAKVALESCLADIKAELAKAK